MLAILSPAKKILVEGGSVTNHSTTPAMVSKSAQLVLQLKKLTVDNICSIMKVSNKIGFETYKQLQLLDVDNAMVNSKEALFAYFGEAYRALDSVSLTIPETLFAQNCVRIVSGFYGVLRPLDLIQPYRLEMGLNYPFLEKGSLYEFWNNSITSELNGAVEVSPGEKALVNLASAEYFSSIDKSKFNFPIITPVFIHENRGRFSTIAIHAKRARGLMVRFIIQNKIDEVEYLKAFDSDGYYFDAKPSENNQLIFRKQIRD